MVQGKLDPKKSQKYQLFSTLLSWADSVRTMKVQANADVRQVMGNIGREYVERQFARETVTGRYRAALEHLVKEDNLPIAERASFSSE